MYKITRIILGLQDGSTRKIKGIIYTDDVDKYKQEILTDPNVKDVRLIYESL